MEQTYPFVNPALPYGYNALRPYIDTETMWLHHTAHMQTYVNNLNDILKDYPLLQNMTLTELLIHLDDIPCEIRQGVRNNAGGVFNHMLYFMQMSPAEDAGPAEGALAEMIERRFGSMDGLQKELKTAGLSVFGSGSAWLVVDGNGELQVITTANQDTPLERGLFPVMIIDVWEHAYYLKHHNLRGNYIDDIFHVIDWSKLSKWFNAIY